MTVLEPGSHVDTVFDVKVQPCVMPAKEKVFSLHTSTDVRMLDHQPCAVIWICFLTGIHPVHPTSATSSGVA